MLTALSLLSRNAKLSNGLSSTNVPSFLRTFASGSDIFRLNDQFENRHMGPSPSDRVEMLQTLGFNSVEELVESTVPAHIRLQQPLGLEPPKSETEALAELKEILSKNQVKRSMIGMGFHETITPPVILRNMLENPGWYTAYTPYQAEIAQGRLECLLNFQTMVADLTGMDLCNASLLDESTAAAEAMGMCISAHKHKRMKFFVDHKCHPQNIGLIETRARALGVEVVIGDAFEQNFSDGDFCGVLVQYPDTTGSSHNLSNLVCNAHESKTLVIAAADLLSLTLLRPPGDAGVDVVVGSAQRFGVPMNYGGPHAGFLATSQAHARKLPGRIIGVSIDSAGNPALRMAMQAREQHIKRAKATSNICTAQALLANMASAYGTYHGPEGLTNIAKRIHSLTHLAAEGLSQKYSLETENYFDTLTFEVGSDRDSIVRACEEEGLNVRVFSETKIGLNFGENFTKKDMVGLFKGFGIENADETVNSLAASINSDELHFASTLKRQSHFMTHPVFNSHHSETRMLRYLKYLENRDLALNTSMISLGSCTMKLNAVSEMIPVTWPEVTNIHPFAPSHQVQGYHEMMRSLADDLAKITGFDAISLAPNSGANGEYAGLLAIKKFHESNGDMQRDVCFVPMSAHGTNPASAVMAGMRVVIINNKENGDIDMDDLRAKVDKHGDKLAAVMITYPSTYGKFEEGILDINELVHNAGGQVYMDGANMNAQVALTSPGFMNADVCHLNLHKTFCIPHGGGGPGVGAIGVKSHLAPFLPGHAVVPTGGEGANVTEKADGAVTAAPYGSAAILPISWMYIKMLGEAGLKMSTTTAILNANYMAKRLEQSFKILYRGSNGQCAHEFIIDLNPFKTCGVSAEDVAKRLQDYGFHSPTMSWPLPGSLMVEPTESEDRAELDRFCDAMVSIRQEIRDIEEERILYEESPLFHAPHTQQVALSDEWDRNYSREQAAFPLPWVRHNKFWPSVGRIDNVYGDRNLICSCPPVEDYMEEEKAAGSG